MAQLIQIKRSLNTATPGSLANGELAYTANGDVLFIGSNSQVVAVGGKRIPGTLTANQSVVVDSNSLIDQMIVGTTVANVSVSASGITLANAGGSGNSVTIAAPDTTAKGGNYYLKADGSWSTVTGATADPGGANTHVQYNDSGTMNGTAGFTYNEATNTVFTANNLYVGGGTSNVQMNYAQTTWNTNATSSVALSNTGITLTNLNGSGNNITIVSPDTSAKAGSYYLKADGTWSLVSAAPGGSDTQVLFNDGGSNSNGSAGFTFTKASNNVTVANAISAAIHSTTGWSGNTLALSPTSNTILLGNSIGNWVISSNGITNRGSAVAPSSNSLGTSLGSATARWVITANTLDATGNLTTTGNVNAAIGYFTGLVNAANFTTTGNANAAIHYAGANVYANSTTVRVGNSIVQTTVGNNVVYMGNSTSNITSNSTTIVPGANGYSLGSTAARWEVYANTATVTQSISVGTTVVNTTQITVAGGPTINSTTLSVTDAVISGNLDVNGTLTSFDTVNLAVNDSIIELARNNAGTTLDIGFYGQYNDGTERFTGLIWNMDQANYELFANTATEPTTTLNTGGTGYTRAQLNSYLKAGWGTGVLEANSTGVTITANSTWAVALTANSLSLTTQLAASSGGTGQTTYADGDLLYGSGSALSKLTRGADGKVLVSTSSTIVWADLDGGTF